MKSPPTSRKPVMSGDTDGKKGGRKAVRHAHKLSIRERLLKGLPLYVLVDYLMFAIIFFYAWFEVCLLLC